MFQTKVVEKIKTLFMFNNFFLKIVPFFGQATDYNKIRRTKYPMCVLDDQDKNTNAHIIFNTLRTGFLNCLNARSRDLIQSEVRFL